MLSSSYTLINDCRILVADDSDISRHLLIQYCGDAGFRNVQEAMDGAHALEKITAWKPNLVLLDLHMPKMNGIEVCEALARMNLLNDVVVILQTTKDEPELKAKAFEAGVSDFLIKPVNEIELVARVRAHLDRYLLHHAREQDYRRMQHEMLEAIALQNVILPTQEQIDQIRNHRHLDIAFCYNPCSELAGDYLSIRSLPDGRVALFLADVSGHGVTSALYAFTLNAILQEKKLEQMTPADVLHQINHTLLGFSLNRRFITMFVAFIDPVNDKLEFSAAASPNPLLLSSKGATFLDSSGYLLGYSADSRYETHTMPFMKGDALLLYSDALIETPTSTGAFMPESDIKTLFKHSRGHSSNDTLRHMLDAFYLGEYLPPTDDLSMLICKRI